MQGHDLNLGRDHQAGSPRRGAGTLDCKVCRVAKRRGAPADLPGSIARVPLLLQLTEDQSEVTVISDVSRRNFEQPLSHDKVVDLE